MPPRSHPHPSLPQSLLEEINGESSTKHNRSRKRGPQLSRKESRKQARDSLKQRKANYFATASSAPISRVVKRDAAGEHADSPQRKKVKLDAPRPPPVQTPPSDTSHVKSARDSSHAGPTKRFQKPKTALQRLSERSNTSKAANAPSKLTLGTLLRTPQEEEEDAYIAYLERKLGWAKGGKRTANYGMADEDDGLGDLLKDLDTLEEALPSFADEDAEGSELSDSFEGPDDDGVSVDPDDSAVGHVEDDEEGRASLIGEDEALDEQTDSNGDEGWIGIGNSTIGDKNVVSEDSSAQSVGHSPMMKAPVSIAGTKYVPPHLRKAAESESEDQLKLKRQMKGLLNRMSEQNIGSIVDGIEELYRSNRRHDVTDMLTKLLVGGISSHSMHLDQYVVLHASLVSALHRLVGIEFVAFFIQHVITTYDSHFAALQNADLDTMDTSANDELAGKECSNLVVLLSELYNFQVISCVLLYDIIRSLLDGDLNEYKVELLLKVVRNSGQQLRQDDPTALKSIVQIVHTKLPQDNKALSSRTRFMVETLSNLKNNKIKKAAGQMAGGEAVGRMKKFLSGLTKKRHVMSHEPLRVSLEDLRSADTKGKWWLVGAAWGGDPLLEHRESQIQAPAPDAPSENVLLKLAKKQGMNTDIRRGIFVVLMSSDDCMDACEKLSQLKLTEVQQREIIRVILHCCGNEKQYNPYYALVGQQLCRLSHSHRITLQFCLWDFLRDMGESTVGGAEILKNLTADDHAGFTVKSLSSTRVGNVACAFGWWIAKDCCTLAVLKPVDFPSLKPQARSFMHELFVHVFANTQLTTPLLKSQDLPNTRNKGALEEVFAKGAKVHTLALGLTYYLRAEFKGEDGFLKWASHIALQALHTGVDTIPVV